MSILKTDNLVMQFGGLTAVNNLNLDIKATFAPISTCVTYPISILGFNNYFVLFGVLCIIVCFVFSIPSKKSNNC